MEEKATAPREDIDSSKFHYRVRESPSRRPVLNSRSVRTRGPDPVDRASWPVRSQRRATSRRTEKDITLCCPSTTAFRTRTAKLLLPRASREHRFAIPVTPILLSPRPHSSILSGACRLALRVDPAEAPSMPPERSKRTYSFHDATATGTIF